MAYCASILKNKAGQQTTLNLVPVLNGVQVVTAKQAYVFGGPVWLKGQDHSAIIATSSASVITYLNGLVQSNRIAIEAMNALKDPWPAKAPADRVIIPAALLAAPPDYETFRDNIDQVSRTVAPSYSFISVQDLEPNASTPTLNLTGLDAFVWYGHIGLHDSAPVVVVATCGLNLRGEGAYEASTSVERVPTSGESPTVLPEPGFDMVLRPFDVARSFNLAPASASI